MAPHCSKVAFTPIIDHPTATFVISAQKITPTVHSKNEPKPASILQQEAHFILTAQRPAVQHYPQGIIDQSNARQLSDYYHHTSWSAIANRAIGPVFSSCCKRKQGGTECINTLKPNNTAINANACHTLQLITFCSHEHEAQSAISQKLITCHHA